MVSRFRGPSANNCRTDALDNSLRSRANEPRGSAQGGINADTKDKHVEEREEKIPEDEGEIRGADTFSFDRKAVKLLQAQGHAALTLSRR